MGIPCYNLRQYNSPNSNHQKPSCFLKKIIVIELRLSILLDTPNPQRLLCYSFMTWLALKKFQGATKSLKIFVVCIYTTLSNSSWSTFRPKSKQVSSKLGQITRPGVAIRQKLADLKITHVITYGKSMVIIRVFEFTHPKSAFTICDSCLIDLIKHQWRLIKYGLDNEPRIRTPIRQSLVSSYLDCHEL